MFTNLIKGAKRALGAVFAKKTTQTPQATPQASKAPEAGKSFKKPAFPMSAVVILAAIIAATLYIEMHLIAIAAGLTLVTILGLYVFIQKLIDAANLAVPDPNHEPTAWPWPTSDSMGTA